MIVFIVCVTLLIFAPKSTNYFPPNTYPILKYIHENSMDAIVEDLDSIKESDDWMIWPDKEYVRGKYEVYPIYMFSTLNKKRKDICINTYNLIQNTPNVKSCAFLRIDANSSLNKNKGWAERSNKTLCCLFILETSGQKIDRCGIWVNGESKSLSKNKFIIFDGSKEHSIYNKLSRPIYALMLDIERPNKLPDGASQREYTDETYDFIKSIL